MLLWSRIAEPDASAHAPHRRSPDPADKPVCLKDPAELGGAPRREFAISWETDKMCFEIELTEVEICERTIVLLTATTVGAVDTEGATIGAGVVGAGAGAGGGVGLTGGGGAVITIISELEGGGGGGGGGGIISEGET